MKEFFLIICMVFCMLSNFCYAENFFYVQRGDSDIVVLRNPLDHYYTEYLEAQRIVNYKNRDEVLLKICKFGEDFCNVDVYYKDKYLFALKEININHDFKFPENKNIHWYEYRNDDWNKLIPYLKEIQQKDPEKDYLRLTLVLKKQDGKLEKENVKLYLNSLIELNNYSTDTIEKLMNEVLDTHEKGTYYQPYFTLLFPGIGYSEVKERFCYNLNAHKKNGDIDYRYYISQYSDDDDFKLLGFKTIDNRQRWIGRNFAWFVENDNGTYMNLTGTSDRSSFGNSGWGTPFLSRKQYDMGDSYVGESFQHTFDTLLKTYQEFYGLKDYGFELKRYKFYENNKFNIKKVNDKNLKELYDAYMKKEKLKIISVNGVSAEKLSGLDFDVITQYKTSPAPVEFVFLNQKTKKNITIVITPRIMKYASNNLDFRNINLKNDIAILEKKTPLDFTYKNNIYFDIFDPYTTSNENIVYHN